tara:strand:- start:2018 stop:2935 length:918 start_codon:yes stop_codon:yes gene_type:complete
MNLIANNGWLNVYKPPNITSSKTVLKIKKQFKLKKIGHAGTLDPNAEGILPIAFGSTTKIISFMENKNKKYSFTIKWGEQTSTDDSEGKIIFKSSKIPNTDEIKKLLPNFIGNIQQIPPKYSAIKINGNRAYDLSRNKIEFKLKPRFVRVYSIKCLKNKKYNESSFSVICGKGFYVRSFARDFAINLSTRGHILRLKREKVGIFNVTNSILLDDLLKIGHLSNEIKGFYPSSVVLDDIPALEVDNEEKNKIRMGKKIDISFLSKNSIEEFQTKKIIFAKNNNELIALGYIERNFFRPNKVFNKEN